jgi:O-antigen/teichoic acid export membrane protein
VYVARLVAPSDFGIFALVLFVIGLAQVVGDAGFTAGLVRMQVRSRITFNTIFWIAVLSSLVLALIVVSSAQWVADFYNMPDLKLYLIASAIGLIVSFLLPVPLAILQINLDFKEIAFAQTVGSMFGAIFVIIAASYGFGIWALIGQSIVGNITFFVLMLRSSKWFPKFEFSFSTVRNLLHDGFNLLGSNIAVYGRLNSDSAIIGKALPSFDLGIFSMARNILYAPNYLITSVASRVLFPLLSKVQKKKEDVLEIVLFSAGKVAFLSLPLYLGLFATAEDFVALVFGEQWSQMALLLKIMVVPAVVTAFSNMGGPILISLGASRANFYINLVGGVLYLLVLWFVLDYGLKGIAIGYAFSGSLIGLFVLSKALRMAGVKAWLYALVIVKPFIASVVMALCIIFIRDKMGLDLLFRFSFSVCLGIVVYFLSIFLLDRKFAGQVISFIRR